MLTQTHRNAIMTYIKNRRKGTRFTLSTALNDCGWYNWPEGDRRQIGKELYDEVEGQPNGMWANLIKAWKDEDGQENDNNGKTYQIL